MEIKTFNNKRLASLSGLNPYDLNPDKKFIFTRINGIDYISKDVHEELIKLKEKEFEESKLKWFNERSRMAKLLIDLGVTRW